MSRPSSAEILTFAVGANLVTAACAPERLPVLMQRATLSLARQPLARQIAAAERRHTSFLRALLPAFLAAVLLGLLAFIALVASPLALSVAFAGWALSTIFALLVAVPVAFKMMLASAVLRAQLTTCAPEALIREDIQNCPATQLFMVRAAVASSVPAP